MKKCCICQQEKDVGEFNKHPTRKDGLQSACKDCNKERSRAYYARNTEHHKAVILIRNRKVRKRIRQQVDNYKRITGCCLCPENEPICLDFHHHENKDEVLSRLIGSCSISRIEEEVMKCSLLCSNCHRKLHKKIITPAAMPRCYFKFDT